MKVHTHSGSWKLCYSQKCRQQKTGFLDRVQLYGSSFNGKQLQDISVKTAFEDVSLTPYQDYLYKKALKGLKMFPRTELNQMSFKEKLQIKRQHSRAQFILNRWKQTIITKAADDFLLKLFPNSRMVKDMAGATKNYTDSSVMSPQVFTELGITQKQVLDRLITSHILPPNFYKLKTAA